MASRSSAFSLGDSGGFLLLPPSDDSDAPVWSAAEDDRLPESPAVAMDDNESKGKSDQERAVGDLAFQAGVQFKHKDRDTTWCEGRFRTNIPGAAAQIPNSSGAGVPGYTDPAIAYTTSNIKRTNVDPYALVRGDAGAISWEAGVRVENMTLEVDGDETDQTEVLPSAHFSWEVSDAGRIRGSVARTIRNAPFEFLFSGVLEEELGSNDFQGNPNLKPETAWGLDIGYEQQLGKSGIAGVNFFYRDVKSLIEIYKTGD